ncbi:MAG: hypothetical protein ACKN9U_10430, partial [Pirellulaceae bacterium]
MEPSPLVPRDPPKGRVKLSLLPSLRADRLEGTTKRGGDTRFDFGQSGPRLMQVEGDALPTRSSRPSQGEGEISLRISLVEGEVGLLLCLVEDGIHRKF